MKYVKVKFISSISCEIGSFAAGEETPIPVDHAGPWADQGIVQLLEPMAKATEVADPKAENLPHLPVKSKPVVAKPATSKPTKPTAANVKKK